MASDLKPEITKALCITASDGEDFVEAYQWMSGDGLYAVLHNSGAQSILTLDWQGCRALRNVLTAALRDEPEAGSNVATREVDARDEAIKERDVPTMPSVAERTRFALDAARAKLKTEQNATNAALYNSWVVATTERDKVRAERDDLRKRLTRMTKTATTDLERVKAERDTLRVERDTDREALGQSLLERDKLRAELDGVHGVLTAAEISDVHPGTVSDLVDAPTRAWWLVEDRARALGSAAHAKRDARDARAERDKVLASLRDLLEDLDGE